jgi:hypothetical protein
VLVVPVAVFIAGVIWIVCAATAAGRPRPPHEGARGRRPR